MALSDPQSITIGGSAVTLPRTVTEPTGSKYSSADGKYVLTVSHQAGRRNRTIVRIDQNKISTSPLTDVKQKASEAVYLLIDKPLDGVFTPDEVLDSVKALVGALSASTYALTTKVIGGES